MELNMIRASLGVIARVGVLGVVILMWAAQAVAGDHSCRSTSYSSLVNVDQYTWIVNLGARDMSDSTAPSPDPHLPVTLSLPAGEYRVTPIQGTYTAFSYYGNGGNNEWWYQYKIFAGDESDVCIDPPYFELCDEDGELVATHELGSYTTAAATFAAASEREFELEEAADLQFTIYTTDNNPCDNTGGMSLKVERTCEPALYLQDATETGAVVYERYETIEMGYDVDEGQSNGDYVVESGADVEVIAGDTVRIADGTVIEEGSVFSARIIPCPS